MTEPKLPRPRRSGLDKTPSKTKPKGTPPTEKQRETMFGGIRSNPHGLSREQALRRYRNGELAEQIQEEWLTTLLTRIKAVPQSALEELRSDTLRLVQDAIDRAQGKAVAAVEITNPDESLKPTTIRLVAAKPDDDD